MDNVAKRFGSAIANGSIYIKLAPVPKSSHCLHLNSRIAGLVSGALLASTRTSKAKRCAPAHHKVLCTGQTREEIENRLMLLVVVGDKESHFTVTSFRVMAVKPTVPPKHRFSLTRRWGKCRHKF